MQRQLMLAPDCPEPPPPQEARLPEPEPEIPPPEEEPAPEPEPEEQAALQEEPPQESAPPPVPPPRPDPPEGWSPQPEPPPRQVTQRLREPTAECPVIPSEKVLLVLDASSSMKWSYNVDPGLELRLNEIANSSGLVVGNIVGALLGVNPAAIEIRRIVAQIENTPGPQRIALAKQALTDLVRASDPGITYQYVTFSPCGPPTSRGIYGPGERAQLMDRIRSTSLQTQTALAHAVANLPALAGGGDPGAPVNVVLLSDGLDSCDGDPCGAAAQVEQRYPGININVVALSRNISALRCVADRTKGQFFDVRDAGQLVDRLRTASGQGLPEHCR